MLVWCVETAAPLPMVLLCFVFPLSAVFVAFGALLLSEFAFVSEYFLGAVGKVTMSEDGLDFFPFADGGFVSVPVGAEFLYCSITMLDGIRVAPVVGLSDSLLFSFVMRVFVYRRLIYVIGQASILDAGSGTPRVTTGPGGLLAV